MKNNPIWIDIYLPIISKKVEFYSHKSSELYLVVHILSFFKKEEGLTNQ